MEVVINFEKGQYLVRIFEIDGNERMEVGRSPNTFDTYALAIDFAKRICEAYDDFTCMDQVPQEKKLPAKCLI